MALSNREKQQRWRERHIGQRRTVQRIASLLLRRTWHDEHFAELGGLLKSMMSKTAIAALRRALKPMTHEEVEAANQAYQDAIRDEWLREHPGRSRADYKRLQDDMDGEVWEWRRAKGKASVEAERAAWEADHPGERLPEHMCSLTAREATDFERWQRRRARKAL